jgi:hypothetical protein
LVFWKLVSPKMLAFCSPMPTTKFAWAGAASAAQIRSAAGSRILMCMDKRNPRHADGCVKRA